MSLDLHKNRVLQIVFFVLIFCFNIVTADAADEMPFKLYGVSIKGVQHVDRKALQKILNAQLPARWKFWRQKPVLTEDDIVDDLKKIKQYYQAHGYFNATAEYTVTRIKALSPPSAKEQKPVVEPSLRISPPSHTAKVVFSVTEGSVVRIKTIDINIVDDHSMVTDVEIISHIPLKEKAPFEIAKYKESKILIEKLFGNRGCPFATVVSRAVVRPDVNTAAISFNITPGREYTFGAMGFTEQTRPVKEVIIERAITFKAGDGYETRKIEQSQRNLYNLDVFKSALIQTEEPEQGKTEVPMGLTLKPKRKQSLKFGVGYGSEDGVRLRAGWIYRNFREWAGRFGLDVKHSDLYQGILGAYTQPYFWDDRSNLTVGGGAEKEMLDSYESIKTYVNLTLNRKMGNKWQTTWGYHLDISRLENLDLTDTDELVEFRRENDFLISSCRVGAVRNSTDNDINPTRGYVLSMMLDTASVVLGSTLSFFAPEFEVKAYYPLPYETVVACRFRAQSIREIENTDHIPIFKRLFLGGSNTVRGYRYQGLGLLDDNGNPMGGLSALNANMELRRRIYQSLSGVLFLDMGSLEDRAFTYETGNLRFGSGVGVRYDTPVGPLRVDLGYKLNPETSHEDRWRIHFSIGQAF